MIRKHPTRSVRIAAIQYKADAEYALSPAGENFFSRYSWWERPPSKPGKTPNTLSQTKNDFLRDDRRIGFDYNR